MPKLRTTPATALWEVLFSLSYYMVALNINLAVFNLLPVPPWDGSRIAWAFLPQRTYFNIMRYERYIFAAFFLLLMMGFLDGPLGFFNGLVWQGLDLLTLFVEKGLNTLIY